MSARYYKDGSEILISQPSAAAQRQQSAHANPAGDGSGSRGGSGGKVASS